jgi:predicted outer membrane protein
MKSHLAGLMAGALLFSTAALAQSAGEKTGANSMLGVAPKTADFVKEAAMSDMLEIESAKIAEQKGNGPESTQKRPHPVMLRPWSLGEEHADHSARL